MTVLFAFLHHVAAFTLVAALAIEFTLLRQEPNASLIRRLTITDAVLGAAATILLVVGLARVFFFEKGAAYYWSNHAFLGKFSLFVVAALLSIIPTIEFFSWRKAASAGQMPSAARIKRTRMIIHVELAAIVLILLFAAIMAKGGIV